MSRNGSEDIASDGAWETLQLGDISVSNWKPLIGKDITNGDFGGNYNNTYERWCWHE